MLILTRKLGEAITIGDDTVVRVVGIRGRQVRLGIDASRKVAVHREEVHNEIQKQKAQTPQPRKKIFGIF